jgi:hypothetical protein
MIYKLNYHITPKGIKPVSAITEDVIILAGGLNIVNKLLEESKYQEWNEAIYRHVIVAVENTLSVDESQILGRSRQGYIKTARMIAGHLIYRFTLWTKQKVGKKLGLDHSTIVHYNSILGDSQLEKYNPDLYAIYSKCEQELFSMMGEFDINNPKILATKLSHTKKLIDSIATTYDKTFREIVENYLSEME